MEEVKRVFALPLVNLLPWPADKQVSVLSYLDNCGTNLPTICQEGWKIQWFELEARTNNLIQVQTQNLRAHRLPATLLQFETFDATVLAAHCHSVSIHDHLLQVSRNSM